MGLSAVDVLGRFGWCWRRARIEPIGSPAYWLHGLIVFVCMAGAFIGNATPCCRITTHRYRAVFYLGERMAQELAATLPLAYRPAARYM